ncbi:LysR family transcriptional regulator [Thiohalomonas denitrificans]|uniref:DNA-binding transcriptional regulator, LysR family n=1 Tax=Thiohalomonas denitrificans TaxID=415747 RepID=A0A1G5Q886_9GAMM|nr:LysR family transcriptional regulator [Thiohalomonas denitrificans]SCZ57601.1 DNA-binding transcriptional regulator, LysR family [Thiohalomonas denitrificans]
MEIEFARTFLAVAAAGNFVGAAARLHVTQSTVSSRIQSLERELGAQLFRRGRGGADLTAAGARFLRHAKMLVLTVEQARHEVGLPVGFSGSITLGARIALWDGYLPRWVDWMRDAAPDISLRMEVGLEDEMIQQLVQGIIDIGVMYTPERRPGLGIERLFDESLLLVTTNPDRDWSDKNYVHIDWGQEFQAQFSTMYAEAPPPALNTNIGWLAMQYLLRNGGSAHFPARTVRSLIAREWLWVVEDSPVFTMPAYMVYPLDRKEECLTLALEGLRELAEKEQSAALR